MTKFNDNFLRACRMQETAYTPLWLARQAGRFQKEYRVIKEKYSLIEISTIPEISAEVTMIPVNNYEVDSAIVFSDILIPLGPMGISFEYKKGYGPLIHNPIKTVADVEKLKVVDPATEMWYTGKALNILKAQLNIPCIGFVGAPFTLASYMIEGGPSKNYEKMKAFMYNETKAWHLLMDKLSTVMANYLNFQIESGAMVVQIFDSWVGALDIDDYDEYVYPHVEKMIQIIKEKNPTTPIISMGVNSAHLIPSLRKAKPDVISLDWKTDLAKTWKGLNYEVAVQGNLDPTALFADWSIIEAKTKKLLDSVKGKPGHIFNLGHGILPETSEETVKRLCKFVHDYTRK